MNNIGKQPKKSKDLNSPNFYNENFRPLKKERYTDTRRWNNIPCSWIVGMNIVPILPKEIYWLTAIPIKIFMEIDSVSY